MLLLLLACVHTAPHAPSSAAWVRDSARVEEFRGDDYCLWETERLRVGDRVLWGLPDPEPEQNWCTASRSDAAWFDVVGEDGPFVSLRTTETSCCPDTLQEQCVTWNIVTQARATLEEYDADLATGRWSEAQAKLAAEHPGGAWQLDRSAFLVGHGHVVFCARRGDDLALVSVR